MIFFSFSLFFFTFFTFIIFYDFLSFFVFAVVYGVGAVIGVCCGGPDRLGASTFVAVPRRSFFSFGGDEVALVRHRCDAYFEQVAMRCLFFLKKKGRKGSEKSGVGERNTLISVCVGEKKERCVISFSFLHLYLYLYQSVRRIFFFFLVAYFSFSNITSIII